MNASLLFSAVRLLLFRWLRRAMDLGVFVCLHFFSAIDVNDRDSSGLSTRIPS